jgi:hypothetical protein
MAAEAASMTAEAVAIFRLQAARWGRDAEIGQDGQDGRFDRCKGAGGKCHEVSRVVQCREGRALLSAAPAVARIDIVAIPPKPIPATVFDFFCGESVQHDRQKIWPIQFEPRGLWR